jgi:hypothetical protein
LEFKEGVVREVTGVLRIGCDPRADPVFDFRVVGLDRLENGIRFNVRECRADIGADEGSVGVRVKEGEGEFMEFFGSSGTTDGVLVCPESGCHDGGEDTCGGRGGDAPKDGSAGNGADFAIGFKEGDDAGIGESCQGFAGKLPGGESAKHSGEEGCDLGVVANYTIVLISVAGWAMGSSSGCFGEYFSDLGVDVVVDLGTW